MTLKQVVTLLKGEGFEATFANVKYAALAGHIDRPPLDGALNRQFSPKHVQQLRRYFSKRAQGAK